MRARLLTIVCAIACAIGGAGAAHAADLTVTTSAPVERAFLRIAGGSAIVDPADDRLLRISTTVAGQEVRVRLLTKDGHVANAPIAAGRMVRPTRDATVTLVGRGLLIAALVVLGGAAGTTLLVINPAHRNPIRRIGVPAGLADDGGATVPARNPLWRRGALAACGVGVAGIALMVAGTLNALGSWDLLTLLTDTRLGHVLDAALVVLIAVALAWIGAATPTDGRLGLTFVLCAVALVALSFGGHATAGSDALLGGVFDAAHMLATALWLGGLVVLVASLPSQAGRAGERSHGLVAAMVVRFSSLAIACVATLVVTGVYRALAELRGLGDLLHTGYGQVLTVKLCVFGLMLAVAGVNRLLLHPRLERAAIGLADTDRGATTALRRSVRGELSLAAAVLAAVAVLAALPPP